MPDLTTRIRIEAEDRTRPGFSKTREGLKSISTQLDVVNSRVIKFIGLRISGEMVADLARQADMYTNINSRLGLVTDSQAALGAAMDSTYQIATETGVAWKGTAELYEKMARSSKALRGDTETLNTVTRAVSQTMIISGGSAQAQNAAIIQLTQAMASGVLRGQEFNSMSEQAPRLLEAIAVQLKTNVGGLREMAKEGELTSDVVIAAIKAQADAIQAEYDGMDVTIGRGLESVTSAMTKYIGETDKSIGASAGLGNSLAYVAENFEAIADAALLTGGAIAAVYTARGASAVAAYIAQTHASALAMQAQTAATVTAAQAEVTRTAAMAQHIAIKLADARAEAMRATGLQRLALVERTIIPLERQLAAATATTAKAQGVAALSAAKYGRAMGLARGAMGLLGGPAGVVTLGAIALGSWALSSDDAADSTESLVEEVDQLTKSLKELQTQEYENKLKRLADRMDEVAEAQAKHAKIITATRGPVTDIQAVKVKKLADEMSLLQGKVDIVTKLKADLATQTDAAAASTDNFTNSSEEASKALQSQGEAITNSVMTAYETYAAGLEQAITLLDAETISAETATRYKTKLREEYEKTLPATIAAAEALKAKTKAAEAAVKAQKDLNDAINSYHDEAEAEIALLKDQIAFGEDEAEILQLIRQSKIDLKGASAEVLAATEAEVRVNAELIDQYNEKLAAQKELEKAQLKLNKAIEGYHDEAEEEIALLKDQIAYGREEAEVLRLIRKAKIDLKGASAEELAATEAQIRANAKLKGSYEDQLDIQDDYIDGLETVASDLSKMAVAGEISFDNLGDYAEDWAKRFAASIIESNIYELLEMLTGLGDGKFDFSLGDIADIGGIDLGSIASSAAESLGFDLGSIARVAAESLGFDMGAILGSSAAAGGGALAAGSLGGTATTAAVFGNGFGGGVGGAGALSGGGAAAGGGGGAGAAAGAAGFALVVGAGMLSSAHKRRKRARRTKNIKRKLGSGAVSGGVDGEVVDLLGSGPTGNNGKMEAFFQTVSKTKAGFRGLKAAAGGMGASISVGNEGLAIARGNVENLAALTESYNLKNITALNKTHILQAKGTKLIGDKGEQSRVAKQAFSDVYTAHGAFIEFVNTADFAPFAAHVEEKTGLAAGSFEKMAQDGVIHLDELRAHGGEAALALEEKFKGATSVTATNFLKMQGVGVDAVKKVANAGGKAAFDMSTDTEHSINDVIGSYKKLGRQGKSLSGEMKGAFADITGATRGAVISTLAYSGALDNIPRNVNVEINERTTKSTRNSSGRNEGQSQNQSRGGGRGYAIGGIAFGPASGHNPELHGDELILDAMTTANLMSGGGTRGGLGLRLKDSPSINTSNMEKTLDDHSKLLKKLVAAVHDNTNNRGDLNKIDQIKRDLDKFQRGANA